MMMGDGNFSPSPSPSKRVRLSQYSLPTSILPSATSHAARDLLSGIGGKDLGTYRSVLRIRDPGFGGFLTLVRGSGKGFFRIPDLLMTKFWVKVRYYNSKFLG
jgi:hypothetical protein